MIVEPHLYWTYVTCEIFGLCHHSLCRESFAENVLSHDEYHAYCGKSVSRVCCARGAGFPAHVRRTLPLARMEKGAVIRMAIDTRLSKHFGEIDRECEIYFELFRTKYIFLLNWLKFGGQFSRLCLFWRKYRGNVVFFFKVKIIYFTKILHVS